VKTALVMHKAACGREEAIHALNKGDGWVSRAVELLQEGRA
jgi:N-acetylmuramic acid 6-phosphate (MurNAc-6-P) etherase